MTAPHVFYQVVGGAYTGKVGIGMYYRHEGHVVETFGRDTTGTAVPGDATFVIEIVVPGPGEGTVLGHLRGEKGISRTAARDDLFGLYLVDDDLVLHRVLPAYLWYLDVVFAVRVLVPLRRLLYQGFSALECVR